MKEDEITRRMIDLASLTGSIHKIQEGFNAVSNLIRKYDNKIKDFGKHENCNSNHKIYERGLESILKMIVAECPYIHDFRGEEFIKMCEEEILRLEKDYHTR